jgi:hypothetical protein
MGADGVAGAGAGKSITFNSNTIRGAARGGDAGALGACAQLDAARGLVAHGARPCTRAPPGPSSSRGLANWFSAPS